ncbi:unnamed protein product [Merluccius merluccius]
MSTQKSFAKGSAAPGPVSDGSIRLYSMRFCPFAQRTRLVLHAKGIKHDIVNINLKDKPDWFIEKNPLGLVPTLETPSGQVIYESPITCEYLDEVYTDNKLLPADPFQKAQQKMLMEHFSKVGPPHASAHTLPLFSVAAWMETPELKKWTERMLEDPAVKDTMHSLDHLQGLLPDLRGRGPPDYDYGL